MEKTAIAAALKGLLIVLAAAGITACTESATEAAASAGISSAQAADPASPLYPPMQADAADGHVHEYY